MDIFRLHEQFEIEVLEAMNSAKLLEPLVFGGGTMLRLCHELNRYSTDLDFWFIKKTRQPAFFETLKKMLGKKYEITDAQQKHYTLQVGLRSANYPRRLKIEIRRKLETWDYQPSIAFSRWSNRQVPIIAHTLKQTMENKIRAFLDRGEIRDCYDIEFLIRRGVDVPEGLKHLIPGLQKSIKKLKETDFTVKLGSILEKEYRAYYIQNRFSFLESKLSTTSVNDLQRII